MSTAMSATTNDDQMMSSRLDRPPWSPRKACNAPTKPKNNKIPHKHGPPTLTWDFRLLATLGLILLHYSRPCDGYGHHRWRHRDQSSSQVEDDYHSLCSRCPPGFGVARRCTQVQDTVCHSCPEGYYAASYSRKHPCWPCSHCGDGLYEAHRCTSTADTICDACSNQHPHAGNGDYDRKCRDWAASQQRSLLSAGHHSGHTKETTRTTNLEPVDSAFDSVNVYRVRDRDRHRDRDRDRDRHRDRASRYRESIVTEELVPTGAFRQEEDTNDEEVAVGVAQLAAFQVVLIFTAVAAILALTCRLRVCSSHETTRLKLTEDQREDGVALIEHLTES